MSRVLLKLSGESFADQDTNFGIESNTLTRMLMKFRMLVKQESKSELLLAEVTFLEE